ncbi:MAG: FtsX-like permease family protein [Bacteroidetes bacterium]|nr:FtsX-like permease family protein [Bacteroidota bacterium]
MFQNNLKIVWRTLRKNSTYSLINVVGLAIGMAAVLLIYRIVDFELGFNKNFENYDRIVRVVRHDRNAEGENWTTCMPLPAANAVEQAVPQFEEFSRSRDAWPTLTVPDPNGGAPLKKFNQPDDMVSFFVEPAYLKIFKLKLLEGDPNTALRDNGSVILTKKWAEKCFGDAHAAMSQTVIMDNLVTLTVRGVMAEMPANCDFPIGCLISYATLEANSRNYFYGEDNWGACSSNNQAFALLKSADQLTAANEVVRTVGEKEYKMEGGLENEQKVHELQPLSDLHYNAELYNPTGRIVTKNRLRILSFIGLLVLAMACFNFINLSTAQATQRAKEVGVRKTLGVSKGQLIGQFMGETATVTVISVLLGLTLAVLCLPLLKLISDVPADAPFVMLLQTWGFIAAMAVAVTLLAGFYPSIVLAGFDPIEALKTNTMSRLTAGSFLMKKQGLVREGLVVLQFAIASAFIVGTIVTLSQLEYIRQKDLGFDKNLVYSFNFNSDSASMAKMPVLRQQLLQLPAVESVSLCSDQPSSGNTWANNFAFPASGEDAPFNVSLKYADASYQKTYGLRLVAGKWLEPSDTLKEVVVNQTLLRKLGISNPDEVVGQELRIGSRRKVRISGVVEDFHSHSIHQPLEPMLIGSRKIYYNWAGIKIKPDNLAATTAAIQKAYDEVYPEQVFSGSFFDETIAQFYEDEKRFSNTCKGFGLLAVFIACLGLFGLSIHAASRRTKEIGVRKVLGASISSITGLLARDFLKLVLISLVVGFPIAWYFMDKWLADFTFHVDMNWAVFAIAGFAAMAVAFLTISFQSVKAALANPVKSLRSE